jgi:hypothetical protein
MAEDKLKLEEVRKMAADIGWSLSNEHLEQLVRATRAAQARRATLPVATLDPADEPAHVFRLDTGEGR